MIASSSAASASSRNVSRPDEVAAAGPSRKAKEESRSASLEKQFDENELTIQNVQKQLDDRLGALKELFGVLQQVSGDARSSFQGSLTNVQFPDRTKFLSEFAAKMGQTSKLPSIDEIERVWFELQREATELGSVERLPNFPVITADGNEVKEDVVRVGAFNLVSDGAYLRKTDNNQVAELQRQPSQGRFIKSTCALVNAEPNDRLRALRPRSDARPVAVAADRVARLLGAHEPGRIHRLHHDRARRRSAS